MTQLKEKQKEVGFHLKLADKENKEKGISVPQVLSEQQSQELNQYFENELDRIAAAAMKDLNLKEEVLF